MNTCENVFILKISVLVHRIKYVKTTVPETFIQLIPYALDVHDYNTRYACNSNLYRPASRTNYGLSRFKTIASRIWEKIPFTIKTMPHRRFKTDYKLLLLDRQ